MKCFNCDLPATRIPRIKEGGLDDRWEAFVDLATCDDCSEDAVAEVKVREATPAGEQIAGLQMVPIPRSDTQWRSCCNPKAHVEQRRAALRVKMPPADVLAQLPEEVADIIRERIDQARSS